MASAADPLAEGFASPPRETRPWCYWYWIDSNATRKGIAKDLEAMAKVGIGGAFIGDICLDASRAGDSRVLSEKWWSLVKTAAAEGARNGVQIGMFNCPGRSMSGGPWIKPEESMRYVVSSETRVKGPGRFTGKLPAPAEPFQDIAVLAFPAPAQEGDAVSARSPRVTPNQAATEAALLFDGRFDTVCPLPKHLVELAPLTIEVTLDRPITVRSMTLHPRQAGREDPGRAQSLRRRRHISHRAPMRARSPEHRAQRRADDFGSVGRRFSGGHGEEVSDSRD